MVARQRGLGLGLVMVVVIAACSGTSSGPTPLRPSPVVAASNAAPGSVAPPGATPALAPQGSATPVAPPTSAAVASCASPCSVLMWERAYSPSVVTVRAGSQVTWTNHACPGCTVTFASLGVDSGSTAVGDTFTQTFTKPGSYVFHCELDPQEMVGIVKVVP
jgi:plastocyanin